MNKVLILFAHPDQPMSKVNLRMFEAAKALEGITAIDLYELYPRFKIDIEAEQQRLLEHDLIIFQFPVYWYSTPALLKEWQDLVLEHGFAYGEGGTKLAGKSLLIAATAGGDESSYRTGGENQWSIRTLFSPLEQTARLCQWRYLSPFVLFSSVAAANDARGADHVDRYLRFLNAVVHQDLDLEKGVSSALLDVDDLLARSTS